MAIRMQKEHFLLEVALDYPSWCDPWNAVCAEHIPTPFWVKLAFVLEDVHIIDVGRVTFSFATRVAGCKRRNTAFTMDSRTWIMNGRQSLFPEDDSDRPQLKGIRNAPDRLRGILPRKLPKWGTLSDFRP